MIDFDFNLFYSEQAIFIWLFFFNFGRDILLYYIRSSEKVTFGSREFFLSLFDFLGGNFGPTGNWIVWMEIDFALNFFYGVVSSFS